MQSPVTGHRKGSTTAVRCIDVAALVAASDGMSGAEIEQAVISGLYAAFADKTECSTEHILAAIQATQPLSVVMRERAQPLKAASAAMERARKAYRIEFLLSSTTKVHTCYASARTPFGVSAGRRPRTRFCRRSMYR